MTNITLNTVSRRYDGGNAVENLNLDIKSGELVALLGPSGCGKTTTLRMIAGLEPPSSGDILFNDHPVTTIPPEKRGAVLVFQKHLLFPNMNVAQNVGFALKMAGIPKDEIVSRVQEMLRLVDLDDLGQRYAHELSGGQQQRVALARGLIANPKVLLLDEPLANLDANLRIAMRQLIRKVQKKLNLTTIFVTHDQEEAVTLADKIVLMRAGKVEQSGRAPDFFERPQSQFVAQFFQNNNLINGICEGHRVRTGVGDFDIGEQVTNVHNGNVIMTVRPETIKLATNKRTPNTVGVKVISSHYLGTHYDITFEFVDQRSTQQKTPLWTMRSFEARNISAGDEIRIKLPSDKIWLINA